MPILVGGLSEIAFRRAVRHEGWVGDIYTVEEACGHAARLLELRAEGERAGEPFEIITALSDAFLPEHFATARDAGITEVWTMPWAYYSGLDATLEQKLDGMRRFAEDDHGAGVGLILRTSRPVRGSPRSGPHQAWARARTYGGRQREVLGRARVDESRVLQELLGRSS